MMAHQPETLDSLRADIDMDTPTEKTKERPILFSGPMVCAILDGTKTQTRRVLKPQPRPAPARIVHTRGWGNVPPDSFVCESNSGKVGIFDPFSYQCPYGKPGDRLWVRETFAPRGTQDPLEDGGLIYKADCVGSPGKALTRLATTWKPSIHMPRGASRLTLEIVSVRVERVQDITEQDAIAEGIDRVGLDSDTTLAHPWLLKSSLAVDRFARLWDSINEKRGFGWDVNPFCWAIEFRQVTPPPPGG